MEAKIAFLADSVANRNGALDVQGMFGILTANEYPAELRGFVLVMVVDAFKSETIDPWPIRIVVEGGAPHETIYDHSGAISFTGSQKEGDETEVQMILNFESLILPSPGVYYFRYTAENRYAGTVTLLARSRPMSLSV